MKISSAVLAAFLLIPVAVPLHATAANLPSTCLPGFNAVGDDQPTYDPNAVKVRYTCMSSQVKCPSGFALVLPQDINMLNIGYRKGPLRLVYTCYSTNNKPNYGRQYANAPTSCIAGFTPDAPTYNPNLYAQIRCFSPALTCPYSLAEAFDPDPMHPYFIGYSAFNAMVYTCFHEVTGIH